MNSFHQSLMIKRTQTAYRVNSNLSLDLNFGFRSDLDAYLGLKF